MKMWLLPSSRRPKKLQAILDICVHTGMTTPGRVLVETSELNEMIAEYDAIRLPAGWDIVAVDAEGMAAKVQYAYAHGLHAGNAWVGVLADDISPLTKNWDTELIRHLNGRNIISADDCDQAPKRMEGATVWSTPLVDAVGWLAPPGLHHLYFDDIWERLGKTTNAISWNMTVKTRHEPTTYDSRRDDTANKVRGFQDADERTFRAWINDPNGYSAAIERIMALFERSGNAVRPDLNGVSIYLTTPDGDGKLDRIYVRSFIQTIDKVRSAGGRIDWGEMPYCADLSLARNRIFGSFLKSPHTHMLMVDSDIGWNPDDVLRLVMTGLDCVGGAGPRKKYPLEFCCSLDNDDGSQMPGFFDEKTQTMEVTHIGTGFLMITKACAERMVQGYPELEFDPGAGQSEFAVFDPLMTPKRHRHADDYAFSERWRAIGGKIHVMPSIWLKHVGSHCFEGSMLNQMMVDAQAMPEAAE